jgi:hypothetical protein
MARSEASSPVSISSLVLVRLTVALAAMTVFMNLLFLSPLENASTLKDGWLVAHNNQEQHQHQPPSSSNIQNDVFEDKNDSPSVSFPKLSAQEGRQHILDLFQEAGVTLTSEMESKLPTWSQVQEVIGPHPYLLGLEQCSKYRDKVPAVERMLGAAGMFNTGTNLVTHLLKQNCEIPERRALSGPHQSKESYGMRWQVPWGKHTPAKFRLDHATKLASSINKDYVLPVVTIRNPYTWFKSMCKSAYTVKWKHGRQIPDCPSLRDHRGKTNKWHNVSVHYAGGDDHHKSLAHLWNDWYRYYIDDLSDAYPFVVVRMEDLIFYPKETTRAICECAGGEIRTDQAFQFIVDSAKADSPGHDVSTGIYAAWIKYSKRPEPRYGFSEKDGEAAKEALNGALMTSLGYQHPRAN